MSSEAGDPTITALCVLASCGNTLHLSSVMIGIYCKKKLIGSEDIRISIFKCSKKLCQLRKLIVVKCTLGSTSSLSLGSWLGFQHQHGFPLTKEELSAIRELLAATKV